MYIPASKAPYARSGRGVVLSRTSATSTATLEKDAKQAAFSLMLQTPSKRAQQRMAQKPSYTPPAVVRKDSGEIVRPCLRRRANTEPATCADGTATSSTTSSSSLYPSIRPPRFVHFGAELERVRWFLKGQCPKSVCSDATPDSHAVADDECQQTRLGSPVAQLQGTSAGEQPATVRLTSLRRPTPSFAIFETSPVVLERVELACSKRSSAALRGTVKVHNVAFEKVVVLRYSFDHWRTTEECQATYTKTLADAEGGRPGVDRFSFTLPLAASATVDLPATIAMCVRYDVGGCEHWDNNCGSNYMFKITHPAVPAIADEEADADAVFTRAAKNSEFWAPPRLTFNSFAAPSPTAAQDGVSSAAARRHSVAYSAPTPADTRRYMAKSAALFGVPSAIACHAEPSSPPHNQQQQQQQQMGIDSASCSPSSSQPTAAHIVPSASNNQLSAHNASAGNAAIAAQPPYMQQQAFSTLPPCSSMQTELPLYQDVAWCGGDFAAYPATAICSSSYSGTFGIDSASMLSAAEYMLAPSPVPLSPTAASPVAVPNRPSMPASPVSSPMRTNSGGVSGRAGSPLATPMRTGSPISRPVFSPNGSVRTGSPLAWSRNTTASALQC